METNPNDSETCEITSGLMDTATLEPLARFGEMTK